MEKPQQQQTNDSYNTPKSITKCQKIHPNLPVISTKIRRKEKKINKKKVLIGAPSQIVARNIKILSLKIKVFTLALK